MPGKGAEDAEPPEPVRAPRYRRVAADDLRRATRRVLRGGRSHYRSQEGFRDAVLAILRRDEPLAAVGGARLRQIAIETPGVRLSVRYRERAGLPPPAVCPVCRGELRPIRNQTLTGARIVLGQRCVRCAYWTHQDRRTPVRYTFSGAGGRKVGST